MKKKALCFPKGFLFGTATSAHQVEGNNVHSDWWKWEKNHPSLKGSGEACRHYELYEQDFETLKNFLGNNAHRLSIEWARIEPEEGNIDQEAVEHYRKVLKKLRSLGISPMVTLLHFTFPAWFAGRGGFEKRSNIKFFERYIKLCVEKYGDLIDFWITINEPNIYVGESYVMGLWPPVRKSLLMTIFVYLNLMQAHKAAYRIIHLKIPLAKVGVCMSIGDVPPMEGIFLNKLASAMTNLLLNDFFYLLTKRCHDFLGINYYQHYKIIWNQIRASLNASVGHLIEGKSIPMEKTDLGWNIYPKGIYHVIRRMARSFDVPIYITENGIADRTDLKRVNFIRDHLAWVLQAISEGYDVRGYFHWSFIDNFEWALGWGPKFGLFGMDPKTFKRIPKKSAYYFAKICKSGELEV